MLKNNDVDTSIELATGKEWVKKGRHSIQEGLYRENNARSLIVDPFPGHEYGRDVNRDCRNKVETSVTAIGDAAWRSKARCNRRTTAISLRRYVCAFVVLNCVKERKTWSQRYRSDKSRSSTPGRKGRFQTNDFRQIATNCDSGGGIGRTEIQNCSA